MTELEQLYRKNKIRYVRNITRYTKDPSLSEELVQEAFIRALNMFHKFDSSKGKLNNWFYKILFHKMWDHYKKKKLTTSSDEWLLECQADPNDYVSNIDNIESMIQIISLVDSPKFKKILELYYIKQYKLEEIGILTSTPLNTVKTVCRNYKLLFRDISSE